MTKEKKRKEKKRKWYIKNKDRIKKYRKEYYKNNPEIRKQQRKREWQKLKNNKEKLQKIQDNKNKLRKEIKQKCVDIKGGKCCICGYNKSLKSLDFHHLEPNKKEFGISYLIYHSYSWNKIKDKLLKELEKCILVCSNCHGEIEEGLIKL